MAKPAVAVDNTNTDGTAKKPRASYTRKAPEVVVELGFQYSDGGAYDLPEGVTAVVKRVHKDTAALYKEIATAVMSGKGNVKQAATITVTFPKAETA